MCPTLLSRAGAPLHLLSTLRFEQVRCLNVHEYVGIDLLRKAGVRVPKGAVATSGDEAERIYASDALGDKDTSMSTL